MKWKPATRCADVDTKSIPDASGVYVFTDWETGEVQYVGMSQRLYNRLRAHIHGWSSCWARSTSLKGSSVWMNWLHNEYADGMAQSWETANDMQSAFADWFQHKYAVVWFETPDKAAALELETDLIKAMNPKFNVT